ncbi:hypothetical protein [Ruegeria atlantica]|uniref:hypothetical protein n=1 Tax=Ruegeria atlantica TaxID=81569 RepID=UPI001479C80D|nr:hypothetical protein [Ruegeria atlantica]
MKFGWLIYAGCLALALAIDTFISVNGLPARDVILDWLNAVFDQGSPFADKMFANAIMRTFLTIAGSLAIILPALWITGKKTIKPFFAIRPIPILYFVLVFFYFYYNSSNKHEIVFGVLYFISLIVVITREHVFFFSQQWICRSNSSLFLSALIALVAFVLLHPLELTQGNVLGTLLMVNLWVYTVSHKNFWMGVSLHMAWNFGFPESALFHYAVFLHSCYLAYGLKTYPKFLAEPFECFASRRPAVANLFEAWRRFWSFPRELYSKQIAHRRPV